MYPEIFSKQVLPSLLVNKETAVTPAKDSCSMGEGIAVKIREMKGSENHIPPNTFLTVNKSLIFKILSVLLISSNSTTSYTRFYSLPAVYRSA